MSVYLEKGPEEDSERVRAREAFRKGLADVESSRESTLDEVAERVAVRLLEEAKTATPGGDPENWHSYADAALVEFVRALGFDRVVVAYDKIQPKWYA